MSATTCGKLNTLLFYIRPGREQQRWENLAEGAAHNMANARPMIKDDSGSIILLFSSRDRGIDQN